MLLREATSETYGPGSIFHHINLPTLSYFYCRLFYFASLFLFIIKIPKKYLIISIRSHSRNWPCRDWQPLITLDARIYLCCVGARDSRVASYWIDTLVLKTEGNTYATLAASPSPLQGKPTQPQDVVAPTTTYLKDLTQSIGRYGGLSWQNWV